MQKPKLSFWQIWNMSFGFLGIQFGFALQNANVSRIFQTLGADAHSLPILWVAAPLTGLLVQPIIGYFSDNTWNRLGRRRPYFLVGAILATIALFMMPNSPVLWVAAGMLWIMDASINVSMEPFRAFVGDMLPSEQRTKGFAMQSFFIGIGAVVASMLPYVLTNYFGVSNVADDMTIPDSVKWSFYIGGIVFLLAVLWTVYSTKEYSPDEMLEFEKTEENSSQEPENVAEKDYGKIQLRNGVVMLIIGLISTYFVYIKALDKELYILAAGLAFFGLLSLVSSVLQKQANNGFVTMMNDLANMPKTMKQLSIVQFFSWFALFAMWIYTTSALTGHILGTTDTGSKLYNDGADWVGVLFAIYNGVAAAVAFGLPILAKKTNRKTTHAISLVLGGIALIYFYFAPSQEMLILSMLGIGVAWASILSMPYAMLTGSLPSNKLGYYMGVFNFFIVIPQLVAASILGFILKSYFNEEPIYALILGGISMLIAAVFTLRVEDKD